MIEKTERKEKYQSLVTLQQCYDILSKVNIAIIFIYIFISF